MGQTFLALSEAGRNGALRWIGGTLVILFFWLIVGSIISAPFLIASGALDICNLSSADPFWLYIGANVTFIAVWLGLYLAVRVIHQRGMRTLVTPAPRISWARLAQGFIVWLALVALLQVVEFVLYPERLNITFNPARWFFFLPFVLILTPLQTSAEELLFRGYWLQGTGRLTKIPVVLAIVNGVLFALPHLLNPEVVCNAESSPLLFLGYFTTGAVLTWYTLRDDRLELALGAHAANNIFGALFVNYPNSALTTPSVITNTTLDASFGILSLVIISGAFYFIIFRLIDRRAQRGAVAP